MHRESLLFSAASFISVSLSAFFWAFSQIQLLIHLELFHLVLAQLAIILNEGPLYVVFSHFVESVHTIEHNIDYY